MNVVVIDYGSGNLRSVAKALERAAAESDGAADIRVTDDADIVRRADRIVLPGVGAFGDCLAGLNGLPGMREALTEAVLQEARPFLGICVGMQLLADCSLEHGRHEGLGWIGGEVTALDPVDKSLKIPHMGWNELTVTAGRHPVLAGVPTGAHAYFVHSFAFRCGSDDTLMASVEYGGRLAAMVGRDNIVGTQFHPEKSQETGLRLLRNFLRWRP
ncbi:MAG: imidazole glycerol phosphate synthase subunit HisH [Proteobacteria bacterium]|nr:imidazole glycerol phosphate synthase subunit HisH [Pseudomonadota bacterium]MDA1323190.1 imidazole glycerol phosphate synthase subunit HisH [Pseudomonadota bacterium]